MPRAGVALSSVPRTTAALLVLTVRFSATNDVTLQWYRANAFPSTAWIDTKIILDSADPNYINTVAKGDGVTGEMSTSDNGKTWTVTTIKIPEFTFGQSS